MSNELQDFLKLSYGELEDLNLKAKEHGLAVFLPARFKKIVSST